MLNRLLKLETKLNNEKHWAYKNLHFFLDRLNAQLPLRVNGKFFWIPIIYGMGLYHLLKTEFFLAPLIVQPRSIFFLRAYSRYVVFK